MATLDSHPLPAMDEERQLPPVTQLAMCSLALVIAAGIYLVSHLPQQVPLTPAIILLALSALVMAVNIMLLVRVDGFPWNRFFAVAKWSALSYVVIAGLLLYVFLVNNVSGGPLVILVLSLFVFAIHVPILMGFTVARYADATA